MSRVRGGENGSRDVRRNVVCFWWGWGGGGGGWGGVLFFFFNDTATTEIYTLSLHDALPIWWRDDDYSAA